MSAIRFKVTTVSFALLIIFLKSLVHGYGSGAPLLACESLTPGHWWNHTTPIEPRKDSSPYFLEVDKQFVRQGETIEVTIFGDEFQGLLLQARHMNSTTPVGTFTTIHTLLQPRDCSASGDSVTHKDPRDKSNGTSLIWTAPNQEFDDVFFVATVAQNHDVFWVGIRSDVIEYDETDPTAEPSTFGPGSTQVSGSTNRKNPSDEPTPEPTTKPKTTAAATWTVPNLVLMAGVLFAAILFKQ